MELKLINLNVTHKGFDFIIKSNQIFILSIDTT